MLDALQHMLGMGDKPVETAQTMATEGANFLSDVRNGTAVDTELNQGQLGHQVGDGLVSAKSGLSDWAYKAIGPVMQSIMASAMRPQQRAPLGGSGHGVSANAGSDGQVVSEITKMAGGDPLQGLSGFKNLL